MGEIEKLHFLLSEANIPHEFIERGILKQICYPSSSNMVASVIFGKGTFGFHCGLLEICGLLTDKEAEIDEVAGHLSAEEIFERILNHYRKEIENEKVS